MSKDKDVSQIRDVALRLKMVSEELVTIALREKYKEAKQLKKIVDELKEIIKVLEHV